MTSKAADSGRRQGAFFTHDQGQARAQTTTVSATDYTSGPCSQTAACLPGRFSRFGKHADKLTKRKTAGYNVGWIVMDMTVSLYARRLF